MADIYTIRRLDRIEQMLLRLIEVWAPTPPPSGLGVTEQIDEEYRGMAKYLRNRQNMAPVPPGKGISAQVFDVTENGAPVPMVGPAAVAGQTEVEVAFDAATGAQSDAARPEFWTLEGATVRHRVRYRKQDGSFTDPFEREVIQEDNYTAPTPNPVDLGATEQIDEVDSATRPTT